MLGAVLDALLGIAPVPGLSLAYHTLRFIVNSIQQVSESRRQLEELARSMAQLLSTLNAEFVAARLVQTTCAGALRDLDNLFKDIQKFVQKELERGFFVALLHQEDRISGINGFYRRIGTIANSFQISALWNVQTALDNDRQARKDDADALNKRLRNLERNQAELRRVLDVNQGNMMAMMVSIERKLASQRFERMNAAEQTFYGHAMQYLTVLSGQQVKVEDWMITPFEVDFGKEVGSGGFGLVYRGTWNHTEVAIKVVRNVAGVTPRAEVLQREIEIWSTLRHPNILQFLGANTMDEKPFIVMPYIPYTARYFLRKWPEYNPIYILRDISLGLEYLHLRTICHGDLKGVNVLVDNSHRALLCDFGLARIKADVTSRTAGITDNSPAIYGSRNWMAPELFTGASPSTRSDMYAFGMTIYELYADEDPLCHLRNHDFVDLVCRKDLRPSRPTKAARLTESIWNLAASCWVKRSSDRPTARAVSDLLSHLVTEVTRRKDKKEDVAVRPTNHTTYVETPASRKKAKKADVGAMKPELGFAFPAMTECDTSPEALQDYQRTQHRTANWVDDTELCAPWFRSPFETHSDVQDNELYHPDEMHVDPNSLVTPWDSMSQVQAQRLRSQPTSPYTPRVIVVQRGRNNELW